MKIHQINSKLGIKSEFVIHSGMIQIVLATESA